MNEIFISYRRADSSGQAGHLRKDLEEAFGSKAVMMDVTGLDKGRDFRKTIDSRLANCKVFLAVIGPSWAEIKDEDGRRLDSEHDLVRYELAAALRRDIPVIPVLVGGSSMPRAEHLPHDVKELAFRDGVELTHARWDSDVQILIKALNPYVQKKWSRGKALIVVSAVALLSLGGWYSYQLLQARNAEIAQREAEAKQAAEQVAQEKAAAEKAAAEKARAERAAAAKAEKQRLDRAPLSDSIVSVDNVGFRPTGAMFNVAYEVTDRSPMRTALQICLMRSGRQVPGTACTIVLLRPGRGRDSVSLTFRDATAIQLKGNGQAVVQSCLVSSGENVKGHTLLDGTCITQPW